VNDYKKKSLPIQKTIVYTGTYYERKDGIITILNAFAKLIESYPDYKLLLTGSPNRSNDYKKILESIRKNGLKKHIVFTGYLSEEALQNVLISSTMLILAKPANRQNLYNFPTKLGEYLISGRPVITTKIGVVGEIFENNKNIIYAENSVQDISDKMQFVIRHQDLADKVGEMGRKYAIENFNYLKHSKQMSNYFKSLY
jgi:glycosyltransferase involved in cell wall biosynthesis